jgi:two-component system OmpR family response regulator
MSTRGFQSVLCVDDDAGICGVVQATLGSIAGLTVQIAYGGEQAIDLAYELRPDLVLMDVMMPGLDGPSTLKRMRASASIADIPVIFMTTEVLPADVDHLLQLGAIGVIGKPFDPLGLYDRLCAVWNKKAAAGRSTSGRQGKSAEQTQAGSVDDRFLQRTKTDIVRLREMIERSRQGGQSVFKEVEQLAHSIHGAGAMCGFLQVSAAGGVIERLVGRVIASTKTRTSTTELAVRQQLYDCTEHLACEVEAAAHCAPSNAGMFQGLGWKPN